MNAVEQLLSDAADLVDQGMQHEATTKNEVEIMLDAGNDPMCTRVSNAIRGVVIVVTISKSKHL